MATAYQHFPHTGQHHRQLSTTSDTQRDGAQLHGGMLRTVSTRVVMLVSLFGCAKVQPFQTKDSKEIDAAVAARYPPGSKLADALGDLGRRGFSCSNTHNDSVLGLRTLGPNGELPYFCKWSQFTTASCSEKWTVELVPSVDLIASSSGRYHHACL